MKAKIFALAALPFAVAMASNAVAGTVTTKGDDNIVLDTTGGGIKLKSSNGNSFQIGGRLQWDYDAYDDVYNGGTGDGSNSELRRGRIFIKGSAGKNWAYKLQLNVDQEDSETNFADAYLQYKKAGPGTLTIGRFKTPFSLEQLTSSKWISTIERNHVLDGTFSGRQGFGVKWDAKLGPVGLSLAFQDSGNQDTDGGDDEEIFAYSARIFGAPIKSKNTALHLGAAYVTQDFEGNRARFRSRLGVHTAQRTTFADFNAGNTDDSDQFGLEAAFLSGPFSIQGEYITRTIEFGDGTEDFDFDGYYLQATYTLTGEARKYKAKKGAFGGIKPKGKNGAWELVARFEEATYEQGATT